MFNSVLSCHVIEWNTFVSIAYNHCYILKKIHIIEVVKIAAMVPLGMEYCAFFRLPDLFEPAIIPLKKKALFIKQ